MLHTENWENAKIKIIGKDRERFQIGTLSEKTIHAVVKNYYAPNEDDQEIPINGKYADIFFPPAGGIDSLDEDGTKGQIIEIQTRSFDKLRAKLSSFLPEYKVTLVLPVPDHKQIIWIDPETGEVSKGPNRKYGNDYTGFKELYRIKSFLTHPNLQIRFLFMDMIEYKYLNGSSKDRKKHGACRYDRIPLNLTKEICIDCVEDYMQFLPIDLPNNFTSSDIAKAARIPKRLVSVVVGIIRDVGIIEQIGKRGRSYLYKISES